MTNAGTENQDADLPEDVIDDIADEGDDTSVVDDEDLDDEAFAVDVVYIANLSNESADCFPAIVARAKEHNALVAANPGRRQ